MNIYFAVLLMLIGGPDIAAEAMVSTENGQIVQLKPLKPQPLNSISFEGFGELWPPDDVTPREAAWLAVLMLDVAAHMNSWQSWDYARFIREHHLERCFKHPKGDAP